MELTKWIFALLMFLWLIGCFFILGPKQNYLKPIVETKELVNHGCAEWVVTDSVRGKTELHWKNKENDK